MSVPVISSQAKRQPSHRGRDEPVWLKCLLLTLALAFVTIFLLLPLVNVFFQAFSKGWAYYWSSLLTADSRSAIVLTITVASITIPFNTLFGVAAAWAIAKYEFSGKTMLVTIIDLPFSVSPVVSGMMFMLLFGLQGFLGPWLDQRDIQIIFALPGLVLVTVFVTFPFVARELIPVMQAAGTEQEQAAMTLGASGWKTFWHVTLPSVKWGLLYGVILCNARAMGEFGAVSVVSGHITGRTDTMPLRVEKLFNEYQGASAFAMASVLAFLALITLGVKSWLEWREHKALTLGQKMQNHELPHINEGIRP